MWQSLKNCVSKPNAQRRGFNGRGDFWFPGTSNLAVLKNSKIAFMSFSKKNKKVFACNQLFIPGRCKKSYSNTL
jgi:hypothetical protein